MASRLAKLDAVQDLKSRRLKVHSLCEKKKAQILMDVVGGAFIMQVNTVAVSILHAIRDEDLRKHVHQAASLVTTAL